MVYQTRDRHQIHILKGGASFARLADNRAPTPTWRRSMSARGWRFC